MIEKTKEQWYDECVALYEAGRLQEAIEELENLAKVHPDYPLVRLALAVYQCKSGNHPQVIEQMKIACSLETEDPFYYTAFSALAIKGGMRAEAEDALAKAQEAALAAYLKSIKAEENQEETD